MKKISQTKVFGAKNNAKIIFVGMLATVLILILTFGTAFSVRPAQSQLSAGAIPLNSEIPVEEEIDYSLDTPIYVSEESGVEIKIRNSGNYAGYPYLTLGTYDGQPITWLILGLNGGVAGENFRVNVVGDGRGTVSDESMAGLSRNFHECVAYLSYALSSYAIGCVYNYRTGTYETTSAAGSAIDADGTANDQVACFAIPGIQNQYNTLNNISGLSTNQALLLCEKALVSKTISWSVGSASNVQCSSYISVHGSATGSTPTTNDQVATYARYLVDAASDFYSSASTPSSTLSASCGSINVATESNNLLSTYGLSSNSAVVVNSNFNSNKMFSLTSSQFSSYVPSALRVAKNASGSAVAYFAQENVAYSSSGSGAYSVSYSVSNSVSSVCVSTTYSDYGPSGSGTCTISLSRTGKTISRSGNVFNTSGTYASVAGTVGTYGALSSSTWGVIKGTIAQGSSYGGNSGNYYYKYNATCSYAYTTNNSIGSYGGTSGSDTYYLRPAMVVDLSKI